MADIELVIKIDTETYNEVCCRGLSLCPRDRENLVKTIRNGTPQPKIGHWIMKHRTHNAVKHYTGQDEMGETHTISVLERYDVNEPYCSECGKLAGDTSQDYCCACGAKMVESQESEVPDADSD